MGSEHREMTPEVQQWMENIRRLVVERFPEMKPEPLEKYVMDIAHVVDDALQKHDDDLLRVITLLELGGAHLRSQLVDAVEKIKAVDVTAAQS